MARKPLSLDQMIRETINRQELMSELKLVNEINDGLEIRIVGTGKKIKFITPNYSSATSYRLREKGIRKDHHYYNTPCMVLEEKFRKSGKLKEYLRATDGSSHDKMELFVDFVMSLPTSAGEIEIFCGLPKRICQVTPSNYSSGTGLTHYSCNTKYASSTDYFIRWCRKKGIQSDPLLKKLRKELTKLQDQYPEGIEEWTYEEPIDYYAADRCF